MTNAIDLQQLDWRASSSSPTFKTSFLGCLEIENSCKEDASLRAVMHTKCQPHILQVKIQGKTIKGAECTIYLVNEYNHILGEAMLNSTALINIPQCEECAIYIKMSPTSKASIRKFEFFSISNEERISFIEKHLKKDTAVLTPTYPSEKNKYLCAFVHARVKAYQESNLQCDVICSFDHYQNVCAYSFEGVNVLRLPLCDLSEVLALGSYKAILVHFFDEKYAEILEDERLSTSQLLLWSHSPETLYWDWPTFASKYFEPPTPITEEQRSLFLQRDNIIKHFNEKRNVSWVFVSDALRTRSEELIGIRFNQAHTISNVVDERVFPFRKKKPALRKKVFFARKFDNVSTYAIDINMQCIVELSKRPCFADMEFEIYGTGDYYDELIKPVAGFPNVHLHKRFLSRKEMAKVHAQNGIALFATRYDSQGVAMGEAAMSGLVVVSSQIDAAKHFLPNDCGLLAETESPVAYADIIEGLYNDPDRFIECSRRCHEKVHNLCRREKTINREIALILETKRNVLSI